MPPLTPVTLPFVLGARPSKQNMFIMRYIFALLFQIVCAYASLLYLLVFYGFLARLTLVVSDSRGRRVLPLLDCPDIICRVYPGAMLENSLPRLKELIRKYQPVSCLIAMGVNDLTYLNREIRCVYPRVRDPFFLANTVIKKMIYIRQVLMDLQPGLQVVFGGLNGVDLNKYNQWEGVSRDQFIIDDCVTQVNSYVRLLNRLGGNYHPRLTSKVHTWRRGRRMNRYHLLPDGLHFGEVVTLSWVFAIHRFHKKNTLGLTL